MRMHRTLVLAAPILLVAMTGCHLKTRNLSIVTPSLTTLPGIVNNQVLEWRAQTSSQPQFTIVFISPSPCAGNAMSSAENGIQVARCTTSNVKPGAFFSYYIKSGGRDSPVMDLQGPHPCYGCVGTSPGGGDHVVAGPDVKVKPVKKFVIPALTLITCEGAADARTTTLYDPAMQASSNTLQWGPQQDLGNWSVTFTNGSPCSGAVNQAQPTCTITNPVTQAYPYTLSAPSCSATPANGSITPATP